MTHVPAPDPFAIFGLPRSMDIDARALEQRYLQLSRECHPDHLQSQEVGDCLAVLQRSAEVNDAWQVLRDPWRRARALIEAASPGALARNKKLDSAFLAEALDLAEEVAFAQGAGIAPLRARLQQALADDLAAVRAEIEHGSFEAAARRFHASHYHQKALQDLEQKA